MMPHAMRRRSQRSKGCSVARRNLSALKFVGVSFGGPALTPKADLLALRAATRKADGCATISVDGSRPRPRRQEPPKRWSGFAEISQ